MHHPEDGRWRLRAPTSTASISVIEPAKDQDRPEGRRRVPFGFARDLEPPLEREPQLWEGED